MQKKLFIKALAIAMLMLLLGVPLMLIDSVIQDRMRYRSEAESSIAADSVGNQTVFGPVLVMPYSEEYEVLEKVDGQPDRKERKRYRKELQHLVFPNELKIDATVATERRHRGIHEVLMYNGGYQVAGDFVPPPVSALPHTVQDSTITPGQPFVALAISDVRGVRDIPRLVWGTRSFEFEQGSGLASWRQGLHVNLPLADAVAGSVGFKFALNLAGMGQARFVPVAKNNHIALTADWPHPQFSGRFLPESYQLTGRGFQAVWRVSALATEAQQQLRRAEAGVAAEGGGRQELDAMQVAFIEPVNVYSMADRATKYGLLFVALTFAAFFLFEVLKALPIHPVQYTLVGLALALFFLLLVSLSEHIAFAAAYLAASAACIALIVFYLGNVLRDWKRGAGFGAALMLLYGVLYGLLSSESNALVMGAILLFAVLAAIMVSTRKVDWYRLGGAAPAAGPEAGPA